jgi:hypothetical protein
MTKLRRVDYKRKPQDLRPGEYMFLPIQRVRTFVARWKPGVNLPAKGKELPIQLPTMKLWLANRHGKYEVRRYHEDGVA